ncbi:MAG: oleate hydratase [Candidatus Paceibacterota bacterium]|jgi:oleate hydratase
MSLTEESKMYLVGGGIASLSAAVYLIRDAKVKGSNIHILEESQGIGGSLDAKDLSSSEGYSMRGIRMFEEKTYNCLFDLMASIPSLNAPGKTLRQEFVDYNRQNKTYSKARLLRAGNAIDGRPLGLSAGDRLNLLGLVLRRESSLEGMEIGRYFTASFFRSNFWYEFCTVFAFQPWHSLTEFRRYLFRFIQDFSSIDTLKSIESSPYNQHEFLVLPIVDWLKREGVTFATGTRVTDLELISTAHEKRVGCIHYEREGKAGKIALGDDFVFVTLGSLVANSSTGSMSAAPLSNLDRKDASWALWENLSKGRPEFGRPSVFSGDVEKSTWTSFTVTFRDPLFLDLMDRFIHRDVNAYGGVNIIDSNWLISIVLSYKPYFINQPEGVSLCWGYGLLSEQKGNFVQKKMLECTGKEILTELLCHLGFEEHLEAIMKSAVCIPCTTPFVTSLFLPRKRSDRPLVVPEGAANFAFLGQYCEIPHEVVFTVEHSVRSAQIAVYSLLGLNKKVAPIYRGVRHVSILYQAMRTLLR